MKERKEGEKARKEARSLIPPLDVAAGKSDPK